MNIAKPGLPSLEALAQQSVTNALKDLHTVMPGFIDSFDPVTQTCSVQPAIQRVFVGEEPINLPVLINVPVSFPSAGGISITLPVKQGDECIVMFSERSLDNWLKFGELRPPNDRRFHDLSDGIVLMGLKSNPKAIANYDPDNLVIRKDDESVSLTVTPTSIDVIGDFNVDGEISCTGTVTADVDVVGGGISLKNHTHPYTWTDPGGSGSTSPPS